MQFSFIDVFLFLGVVQGFFLAYMLLSVANTNKKANGFLAIILIIASLMLAGRFIFIHHLTFELFRWISLVDCIIFLFGPMSLVYLKRLTEHSMKAFTLSFYHYLPAVIHFLTFLILALIPVKAYSSILSSGSLDFLFNLVELGGLIFNVYYLTLNAKLLMRYFKSEKSLISYDQSFFRYLQVFLIGIGLCLASWFFSYVNAYYFNLNFTYLNYQLVWIIIPLFIYSIGYFSLKQPELFKTPIVKSEVTSVERLSEFESKRLSDRLDKMLTVNEAFLENDLTLSELAKRLETSPNNLSWLINNQFGSTFYDYINGYRIAEFIERLHQNEHLTKTLFSIALEVGFNSKSTFNKAFKMQSGTTPSQYVKLLKNRPQVA